MLQTLGVSVVGWVWGVLFAAGGLVFLRVYQQDNTRWWALIPGFTLLGLGALLLFEPVLRGSTGGALFLAAIGVGFLATYLVRRSNWWAIIPAGTLLTLALVAWQGDRSGAGGVLFFLGLAVTFGAVFLVGQRWAVYPLLGCLVLMLFASEALQGVAAWAFPLVLVAAGAYLLLRSRGGPKPVPVGFRCRNLMSSRVRARGGLGLSPREDPVYGLE